MDFFAGLTPVPNTDKLQTDSTRTTLCAVCVAVGLGRI